MILKGPKKETCFSLPSKVNKTVQVTRRTCTLAKPCTTGHASWATTQAGAKLLPSGLHAGARPPPAAARPAPPPPSDLPTPGLQPPC